MPLVVSIVSPFVPQRSLLELGARTRALLSAMRGCIQEGRVIQNLPDNIADETFSPKLIAESLERRNFTRILYSERKRRCALSNNDTRYAHASRSPAPAARPHRRGRPQRDVHARRPARATRAACHVRRRLECA